YQLSKEMFLSGDWPEAIYTSNNNTSLGFLKAANECGIRIGKDIAIIGNDQINILDMLGIPFSYIERDNYETGRVALRMLLERIENPSRPRNICMIPYSVQLKGSEKISQQDS
ncbi:MAG TPA: substrate-binding domain-containing protein, partial [Anaerovoracaceae bacterium]|nr:substrate-binding domain-containing protein [Anaerovoracaceae bacterium]